MFDWISTARIIKENQIQNASIMLDVSLENTYPILKKGIPVKSENRVSEFNIDHPVIIDDDTGQIIKCISLANEACKMKKIPDISTSKQEDLIALQ